MDSSIESIKLKVFLNNLLLMSVCPGVTDEHLQDYASLPKGNDQLYYKHVMCGYKETEDGRNHQSTVRSVSCQLLLVRTISICRQCQHIKHLLTRRYNRSQQSLKKPITKHHPLLVVARKKLVEALKKSRQSERRLKNKVDKFKLELKENSILVNQSAHDALRNNMQGEGMTDPLIKLFWKEQIKAFQTKDRGMRWHPMMLRLAILLHSRSSTAYETLRKTGILKLPGESTLRDYTNVFHPQAGFNFQVLDEIRKNTAHLEDHERFVVLLHDEMAVKSDLVFDCRSGEIVGFINTNKNSNRDYSENVATHALVFYIVGLNTTLKTSIGFFGTRTATAEEIFPLFWEAVRYLEFYCNLKVIASTCDKASSNQKFQNMHSQNDDICYRIVNKFVPSRYIFFFSDVPHLIKTVRNNLSQSGMGQGTKLLWNNGFYILWSHILDVYKRDIDSVLHRTKLTSEHVQLTSHSVMNVRLAAQVLSHSVGSVIQAYGDPHCQETARFILLMDRFFDCLNARSLEEGILKRKSDLLPYTSSDDTRFSFLSDTFLGYLNAWKTSAETRPGDFTKAQRKKMFLSEQTYKGLCQTVKSFVEVTRYLLANGVSFVLSHRFNQDPIEEHFGRHRGLGRTADNPNLWSFAYQEQKLRLQRELSLHIQPRGNICNKRKVQIDILSSPLKKKRRNKHSS